MCPRALALTHAPPMLCNVIIMNHIMKANLDINVYALVSLGGLDYYGEERV